MLIPKQIILRVYEFSTCSPNFGVFLHVLSYQTQLPLNDKRSSRCASNWLANSERGTYARARRYKLTDSSSLYTLYGGDSSVSTNERPSFNRSRFWTAEIKGQGEGNLSSLSPTKVFRLVVSISICLSGIRRRITTSARRSWFEGTNAEGVLCICRMLDSGAAAVQRNEKSTHSEAGDLYHGKVSPKPAARYSSHPAFPAIIIAITSLSKLRTFSLVTSVTRRASSPYLQS